ncbi:hypothetical protein ACGFIJ_35500 [Microbispora bryophytorum]|uniref:hypothetical protein n=1 Tax=Microbispora bryophytorum TaxID=1460882 RepID=UPI00371C20C1
MHGSEGTLDELEHRLTQLRRALRTAMLQRDTAKIAEIRAELKSVESAWDEAAAAEDGEIGGFPLAVAARPSGAEKTAPAGLLPVREQAHQVLTLLGVPAAPKLISAVQGAFFADELQPSRLASLRRDEERSYRTAPNARPYYLCPALTADLLAPARALLTVSTWPMEQRIIGGHSPRVDFLTAARKVAEAVVTRRQLGHAWSPEAMFQAEQLLRNFAANIPGALPSPSPGRGGDLIDPDQVAAAAAAELVLHADVDEQERAVAAERARRQLSEAERLFGTRLSIVGRPATMER